MVDALHSGLRDRVDPESLLENLVLVAFIYWQFRTLSEPLHVLAVVVVIAAIVGLAGWLVERYDLRPAVKSLALGAVAAVYGAALFVFGGVPQAVAVGLFVVGVWFLFDAVQVVRHDGLYADVGSRPVPRDDAARKVDYALRDRPRTKRELCDELDLDAAAVDDALATLDERRVLTREGSELRTSRRPTDDEDRDRITRVQRTVRRGASRLARPVTVEFQK